MFRVRAAGREDSAFIVDCQLRMAMETEGLALSGDTVALGVRGVFDQPHRGQYFIAEADGRPAGCLLTVPEWSDWRNGTVMWIHSVYVRPEHRRRSAFRALYAHLRQMVERDPALKGLRLYVHKDNHLASDVYRAMGMDGEHYRLFEWMKE
jgi:GNAT superfamily N-acetyltransferase